MRFATLLLGGWSTEAVPSGKSSESLRSVAKSYRLIGPDLRLSDMLRERKIPENTCVVFVCKSFSVNGLRHALELVKINRPRQASLLFNPQSISLPRGS